MGDDEGDNNEDEDDAAEDAGRWPAYTTILKSPSGHITIGVQDPRLQLIFEKTLALADKSFFFVNPFLEYPNKLSAFRRLLLTAAEDKEVGDATIHSRWKVDRRQMMLAKGIVSLYLSLLTSLLITLKPEGRFCNQRSAVKRAIRNIVPTAYNLDTENDCVWRVTELLQDRRYIYGVRGSGQLVCLPSSYYSRHC